MKRTTPAALAALLSTTGIALAEAPKVVTDIAPIYGLVARVMVGVAEPELLVSPGSSPHNYAMRPSNARALNQADLIVWIGESLTPWLDHPIKELGTSAHVLELLETEGGVRYEFRTGATFAAHGHNDAHDTHHDDDHADHKDHTPDDHTDAHHEAHTDHTDHDAHEHHADHEGHTDHEGHDHDSPAGHSRTDHGGHDHSGIDSHAWLAPENGKAWLALIAEELSELDPDHAETYQANAAAGQAEIDSVVASLRSELAPVADKPFVVFHDAYQYFERGFDLAAAGAISIGDASKPSAARIAEIQDTVRDLGVACIFYEPQFNAGLVRTVAEAGDIKQLEIDPLGFKLDLDPNFYVNLLQNMGHALAACK